MTTGAAVAAIMALSVSAALGSSPANAIGDPSAFEAADGNMTVQGSGALDWNCLTSLGATGSTGSCGSNDGSYNQEQDLAAGTSNDVSWPSGTKLDAVCPVLGLSSDPGKDTFTDIASYHDTLLSTLSSKIDTFLYGATLRQTANGSASENVVLQQGTGGNCTGEPTGVAVLRNTVGDKLIGINYGGSGIAAFNVLTWIGTGSCVISHDSPPCWGNSQALSLNFAEGQSNLAAITAAQNGLQVGDAKDAVNPAGGAQALVAGQFAEFGIDLVSAGVVSPTACEGFAQTMWESRSSGSSFTSNPEDVEIQAGHFSTCQPASINIVKQDSTGHALAGATFGAFLGNPPTGTALATCTTDANGNCTLSGLNGSSTTTYTVEELSAPNGYNAGPDQTCQITFSQTAQNPACTPTFKDTPAAGQINIQKTDNSGNPLQGAKFTLYTENTSSEPSGDSATQPDGDDTPAAPSQAGNVICTTNAAGTCSFNQVVPGAYTVFETATPVGYQTSAAQDVTVGIGSSPGNGDIEGLTFKDPFAPATISVVKQDSSSPPKPLSGATFSLYAGGTATGTALGTCTTDSTGGCSFGAVNVTQGTQFTIAETTAPNGYSAGSSQTFSVTWTNSSQTITRTFADTPVPGTINIQKNDGSGHALAGAVFTLEQNGSPVTDPVSGMYVTCTTGADGKCSFTNVALGDYTVVETTTPAGFQTAPTQNVTVGLGSSPGNGDVKSLTFVDPAAPATIKVLKTDDGTPGKPLTGATFQLFRGGSAATGTLLGSCTTDSNGGCSFGQFTGSGTVTYTISELTPPNGYSSSPDQTFPVIYGNSSQTIIKTFTDSAVPGTINIHKTDDATPANALAGATFKLYTENTGSEPSNDSATAPDGDDTAVMNGGNPVTCTTDSAGTCSFQSVPLGSYTLFETTTPAGHQTAPSQDVTIGLGSAPATGDTESLSFVDPRSHKVIVITCEQGTNTLDGSSVSFDGGATTQQTLDHGVSLPGGMSEAQLCSLGGATKSDLPEGKLSPDVQVNVQ
jgi:uncharacterized surface anchored protein